MAKVNNINTSFPLRPNKIVLLILFFFALLSILSSAKVSVTLDENIHYQYGIHVVQGNSTREIDSSMPVSALNALPMRIASFLPEGDLKSILNDFAIARLMTIIVSIFLAHLVFKWSHSLYGFVPAIFSLLLFIFDPNIIAHSQLVTTDLYFIAAFCLTFYRLWLFANERNLKNGLLFLLALGISQIAKYTAITLFPLCFIALFLHDWTEVKDSFSSANRMVLLLRRYIGYFLAAILISGLVINIGFLFNRSFTRLGEYQFRSAPFIKLQDQLHFLQGVPVPVPYPYLEGLDWMLNTAGTSTRYGNLYLMGKLSKPEGFPGYYLIASLLKTPIASQIIIGASFISFIMYLFSSSRRRDFLRNEVFLIVPIIFIVVYFNFFFDTQIGIRYYLIIFPLLYIFSGSFFTGWEQIPATRKTFGVILITYLIFSVLSYFPYYIPYFNELVWDKTQTYKYLSDSNLDWGQGVLYLEEYLAEHPDAVYAPGHVQAGTLIVSGSDLVGIVEDPNRYAWLRTHFEPVDTIAYCYFVYEISTEDVKNLCISTDYCK